MSQTYEILRRLEYELHPKPGCAGRAVPVADTPRPGPRARNGPDFAAAVQALGLLVQTGELLNSANKW
jgi:hypothetical protein